MATAYGSRDGQDTPWIPISGIDISAVAADKEKLTVPTGWEGYLDINKCFLSVTTAVANATPDGTIVLKKGSTTVATYTVPAATIAVDSSAVFTPASGYEQGVAFAAGDVFTISHTKDTGTGVAGVFTAYTAFKMAPLAR